MLKKTYSKDKKTCRVTFEIPVEAKAHTATLCGDFTDWEKAGLVMKQRKDGSFSVATTLKTGKEYHFRYWLDDSRWENDYAADAYAPNAFGTEDSLVKL